MELYYCSKYNKLLDKPDEKCRKCEYYRVLREVYWQKILLE